MNSKHCPHNLGDSQVRSHLDGCVRYAPRYNVIFIHLTKNPDFCLLKTLAQSNRKISMVIEMYVAIDLAIPGKFLEESQWFPLA